MRTRFAFTCSALVAVVLAAAVSDQWPDHPVPGSAGPAPSTVVRTAASSSPGQQTPATLDCDPRNVLASLRPQGPLPAPGQLPAGSTMARIAKRGYLIATVLEDTYPLSFRDFRDVNLRLEGFDIDLVRDIAEAIFGDRERVVFRPVVEAQRFEPVRSGQVDLAVVAATITCQRRELVDFSAVYYQAGARVLVNRDSGITGMDGLRGKRVCAARGSTTEPIVQATTSQLIPVIAATQTDCLMLLQLGEADAVTTDDTILAGLAAQDPRTEVVGPRFTAEPYGVVINKDAPDLVRFVNAVLERRAEDGRWRASYQHWLTALGPPPSPPAPQYRD